MNSIKKLSSLYAYSTLVFFIFNIPFFDRFPGGIQVSAVVLFLTGLITNLFRVTLPNYILFFLVPLCTYQVFVIHSGIRSIEAGVSLMMLLSLLKILEQKELRDYFLFVLISIILLVGHMLNTDSLWFTLYALGALYFAFYSMVKVRFSSFGRTLNLKSLRRILFIIIPITFILFFLFPRFPINTSLWGSPKTTASSGFSEEISPGKISKMVQSDKDVFRSTIGKKIGLESLYWRGVVFTENFGMEWKKDTDRPYRSWRRGKKNFTYNVDFDTDQVGNIFTLNSTGTVFMKSAGQVYHSNGATFKAFSLAGKKIRYIGHVYERRLKKLKNPEKYLRVPNIEPELVNHIKEKYKDLDPQRIISKFLNDLRSNQFEYSLSPGLYSGKDQLSEFYFRRKIGFCEHYASLTAFSFRVLGIPTRIVGGFHGGSYNEYGDYYLIKEKDAHAWVEVWLEGKGWTLVDPVEYVAPARIQLGARNYYESLENQGEDALSFFTGSNRSLREMLLAFDLLYYDLNVFFVNYDREQQLAFLKKFLGNVNVKKLLLVSMAVIGVNLLVLFSIFYFKRRPKKNERLLLSLIRTLEKKTGVKYDSTLPLLNYCQLLEEKLNNYEDVKSFFEYYNKLSYSKGQSVTQREYIRMYKELINGK